MPFLLAEILNFQGSTHLIGVGSLSYEFVRLESTMEITVGMVWERIKAAVLQGAAFMH